MSAITRRTMLAGSGTIVGAAALAACASKGGPGITPAVAGGSTGSGAGATTAASLELKAGALADVPVGGARLVAAGDNDLIVTQPTAGQPKVFVNKCTHQGCKVAISGSTLVCPCHNSIFDFSGNVKQGPATAPLAQGKARVDGGQIIVESL